MRCASPIRSPSPRLVLILTVVLGLVCLSIGDPAARASARVRRAPDGAAVASASRARDVAATRAYIQADYRLARFGRANLSASQGTVHAFVRRTVGECPLAGEGSYVNDAAGQVSEEIVATIAAEAYRPDLSAIRAFIAALRPLRWSDARLTHDLHRYLARLESLVRFPPANVCEDVKTFAASSFRTAPAATTSYDKRYLSADVEAEEIPLRLLAPYEDAQLAALLHRIKQLEAPLAEAEAEAVAQWQQVMRGLALSA